MGRWERLQTICYLFRVSSSLLAQKLVSGLNGLHEGCASRGLCYGIPTLALQVYITVFFLYLCVSRLGNQHRDELTDLRSSLKISPFWDIRI